MRTSIPPIPTHPRGEPSAQVSPARTPTTPSPEPRHLHPELARSSAASPAPPPPELAQLDAELRRLARGAGRLRLRIGQALHRLADGIHELGFSTLGAYSLERCNRGGRWAAETRTLARRLESLPHLTQALESGTIGWSMAELLARHATPQTEAALLQVARAQTVQSMRVALGPQPTPPEPNDDDDHTRTLSLTLPIEDAWALEATRTLVDHMDGKQPNTHFLESLLAEATVPLLELTEATRTEPASANPAAPHATLLVEAEHAAYLARMQQLQALEANAELASHPTVTSHPEPGEAPNTNDLPTTIQALDARLRHYSAELASRDLFFGRIAQRFLSLRGWQALGFATEAHYARDRLGMSRASLRSKVSLARRSQGLDHIIDALQRGRIGFEAAQLIARIATPATERAWVTRATRRTFKHLREEVQAVEMATRYTDQTDHSPPTESQLHQTQAAERAILSGELLRRVISNLTSEGEESNESSVQISGSSQRNESSNRTGTEETSERHCHESTVQISVGPDGDSASDTDHTFRSPAQVILRMRVPGDVLLHYRQLERIHREALPETSFIKFLCMTFWQTWVPHLGTSDKWEQIYRRDRYRCTNPVCHNRDVTLHHVKYRANGGTDDPDNLTSPCAFCHLEGEHGGRLKILPPGTNPTWLLGRHPIMRIQNRERTLLD